MDSFIAVCLIVFITLLIAQVLNPVDGMFTPRSGFAWIAGALTLAPLCAWPWYNALGVAIIADYATWYIGISILRYRRRA